MLLHFLFSYFITSSWAIECPRSMIAVSDHYRTEYYRNDGTHVSATDVRAYCRPVQLSQQIIKFGRGKVKDWPFPTENFKKLTQKEKKHLERILKTIPDIVTHQGEITLYRADKSMTEDNPATSMPEAKVIVLYESAIKGDTKRVLIHELAHLLYQSLPDDDKKISGSQLHGKNKKEQIILSSTEVTSLPLTGSTGPTKILRIMWNTLSRAQQNSIRTTGQLRIASV